MGNCLKGESDDDVSLLQNENGESDNGAMPPPSSDYPIPAQDSQADMPVYHLTPSQSRAAHQLTEEEQIRIAQRIGLIQYLPQSTWDNSFVENKKIRECCICMMDFEEGEPIRYLPCMHYYHADCIDDWLMRSFTCPSCMEPVDGALLSSYGQSNADATA